MADEEDLFEASLKEAEKMTESELLGHLRHYESVPIPYRAYQAEFLRRTTQKLDRMGRNVRFCVWIVYAVSISSLMILIWLFVRK